MDVDEVGLAFFNLVYLRNMCSISMVNVWLKRDIDCGSCVDYCCHMNVMRFVIVIVIVVNEDVFVVGCVEDGTTTEGVKLVTKMCYALIVC